MEKQPLCLESLQSRFPKIELFYETINHKKVVANDEIVMSIPYGKKVYAWFTYHKSDCVCIIVSYDKSKHIIADAKISVLNMHDEEWLCSAGHRQHFATTHHSLESIIIYNQKDKENPVYNLSVENKIYLNTFKDLLQIVHDKLFNVYPKGEFKRVLLHKLKAGKNISEHTDVNHHLETSRRVHIPIVTNNDIKFTVNEKVVSMKCGTIVEINNNLPHSVLNNSLVDRVHLIVDWNDKDDPFYF